MLIVKFHRFLNILNYTPAESHFISLKKYFFLQYGTIFVR